MAVPSSWGAATLIRGTRDSPTAPGWTVRIRAEPGRPGHLPRLVPVARRQLHQDVRDVVAPRLAGQEQRRGDLRVRPPPGDLIDHLELPRTQHGQRRPGRPGL